MKSIIIPGVGIAFTLSQAKEFLSSPNAGDSLTMVFHNGTSVKVTKRLFLKTY